MDKQKKEKYQDPVIEDLVLDITDYVSVMKGAKSDRETKT